MRKSKACYGLGGLIALVFVGMLFAALNEGATISPLTSELHAVEPTPSEPPTTTIATPAPVPPIASIVTPFNAKGTFMAIVTRPPDNLARNTWSNNFPPAEDGKPYVPAVLPLKTDGQELWIFQEPPAGPYIFRLRSQIANKEGDGYDPIIDLEKITVVSSPVVVAPPPVTPPVDPTKPTDPVTPPTDPSWTITEPGLRVLVVYESDSKNLLDVIDSNEFHKFLFDQCDGGFRRWDGNSPLTNVATVWQKATKLVDVSKVSETPAILISNGKAGEVKYLGPDTTIESLKALVLKYKPTK